MPTTGIGIGGFAAPQGQSGIPPTQPAGTQPAGTAFDPFGAL